MDVYLYTISMVSCLRGEKLCQLSLSRSVIGQSFLYLSLIGGQLWTSLVSMSSWRLSLQPPFLETALRGSPATTFKYFRGIFSSDWSDVASEWAMGFFVFCNF